MAKLIHSEGKTPQAEEWNWLKEDELQLYKRGACT
jgi:hypothetical protein